MSPFASTAALCAVPLIALFICAAACALVFGVPASRADAHGVRVLSWTFFGNDDGGLYGEYDDWSYLPGNGERTWSTQVRWWFRNPFHNLTHHVLAWTRDRAIVLYESPSPTFWSPRPPTNWIRQSGPQLQITVAPLFTSWAWNGWEGYAGWRESGELGLAFRKSNKFTEG